MNDRAYPVPYFIVKLLSPGKEVSYPEWRVDLIITRVLLMPGKRVQWTVRFVSKTSSPGLEIHPFQLFAEIPFPIIPSIPEIYSIQLAMSTTISRRLVSFRQRYPAGQE
jgi:hypothetical protein